MCIVPYYSPIILSELHASTAEMQQRLVLQRPARRISSATIVAFNV